MISAQYRNWKRVSKVAAEKLYNRGIEIIICPCKVNPFAGFGSFYTTDNASGYEFWETVNYVQQYMCNREDGSYPAYYVEVKK